MLRLREVRRCSQDVAEDDHTDDPADYQAGYATAAQELRINRKFQGSERAEEEPGKTPKQEAEQQPDQTRPPKPELIDGYFALFQLVRLVVRR